MFSLHLRKHDKVRRLTRCGSDGESDAGTGSWTDRHVAFGGVRDLRRAFHCLTRLERKSELGRNAILGYGENIGFVLTLESGDELGRGVAQGHAFYSQADRPDEVGSVGDGDRLPGY